MYEALHVFEVALRNAVDQQLSPWNARQIDRATRTPHSTDWLIDPSHLLIRLLGKDLIEARGRAGIATREGRTGGRTPTHPDVLTQLTFGTWRYLLPGKDPGRRLLWRQALSLAFPHLAAGPVDLVSRVSGIHALRNRVAHLEPLLASGVVRKQFNNMRTVLTAIDPIVDDWFTSNQRVTRILRTRP